MRIWKLLIPFCAMVVVGCASQNGAEADGGVRGSQAAAGDREVPRQHAQRRRVDL